MAGCAVNPVTGERELSLISTPEQIAIGEQQYFPSRQMQGGDYVVDPALADYVEGVGQRIAQYSDLPLPYEFVVLNNSVPNAWALPGGKIAVNRGLLLELGSEAELAAVLGHEIVHAAAGHGAQAMQRGMILQGVLIATAVAAQRSDYSGLAIGAASVGAQLLNQRYSREAELEADAYGITYMAAANYDPAAAISLQETFVRLSENRSGGWLEGLFASHPPSQERVDRNRETVALIPPGGDVGRESFEAATRRLRETQPAYEAHDEARAALNDGRIDEASQLANRAVELVPQEALFRALEGDIEMSQERYADAVAHYADAIELDDRFFYYQLQKGLAHYALNQGSAAETHLLNSLELLPTADAHYALGAIAESRGDRSSAIEHYTAAAGSNSRAGQAAQEAVIRLDLPQNPGRYLRVGAVTDAQGQLIAQVANPTGVAVANVVLLIRYVDASGAIRQTSRVVNQALGPGAGVQFATGLGPFTSPDSYQIQLQSARVVTN